MKVITLYDYEFDKIEKILANISDDESEVSKLKKELDKKNKVIENFERSLTYWKTLYASEKENWVRRYIKAMQNCRDFGLTDRAVMDLFNISSTYCGTLDGYIRDLERIEGVKGE